MDSNLVWEPPERTWRQRADARLQPASLRQAREKLHGARPQDRLRAASRLKEELALAPPEQADAQAPWQQLGSAQENSSRPPQVERSRALEWPGPEQALRVLLRRRSQEARQDGSVRQ
jgi:hypothetical protein